MSALILGKKNRKRRGDLGGHARRLVLESLEERALLSATPLTAPSGLSYASVGANCAQLSWDSIELAAGYAVSYSTDGELWSEIRSDTASARIENLTYSKLYTYKVRALAPAGSEFCDSGDSEAISYRICPMDMNSDGKINLNDYQILVRSFGSKAGGQSYDVRGDVNGDGKINLTDYFFLSQNYLKNADDPSLVYPVSSLTVTTLSDTVNPSDGVLSLREAIAAAQTGDQITFDASLDGGVITLTGGELTIERGITVDASALGQGVTLDAQGTSRVLWIENVGEGITVLLRGLTIQNGSALWGGGIYNGEGSSLTLTDCVIAENLGAGIYNLGSLTLDCCLVRGNTEGGIGNFFGEMNLTNCAVIQNSGTQGGGIASLSGIVRMTNCTVAGNTALAFGGGIYGERDCGFTLYNSIIAKNTAEKSGNDFYLPSGKADGDCNLSSFTGWTFSETAQNYLYDPSRPLFVNPQTGDYSILSDSQAADSGKNEYVSAATDLTGNPRIVNQRVDLGAYEWAELAIVLDGSGYAYHGIYDGLAHSIQIQGLASTDNVRYRVNGGEWVGESPVFTDAGEYTVEVYVQREGHDDWTASASVLITPKTVQIEWSTIDSYVYNGQDQTLSVTAFFTDVWGRRIDLGVTIQNAEGVSALKNAGIYTAQAEISEHQNYMLTGTEKSLTVNQYALTVMSISISNKTYDGTIQAKGTYRLSAAVAGETVTLTGGLFEFDSADAGDNKTVIFSGYDVSDSNYRLTNHSVTAKARITPKSISVRYTVFDKVYDGTTFAEMKDYQFTGMIDGEEVFFDFDETSLEFSDPNAGKAKAVSIKSYRLTNGNYKLANPSAQAKAAIAACSVTACWTEEIFTYNAQDQTEKITAYYDDIYGNRMALTVTITQSGAAAAFRNAGIYEASASSNDANYTVKNQTQTMVMNQYALTVKALANDKVYDGTTQAAGSYELLTPFETGVVSLTSCSYTFDNANAGTDKVVTLTGYRLVDSTGSYTLANTSAKTTASIAAKETNLLWKGDKAVYTYNSSDQSSFISAYYDDVYGQKQEADLTFNKVFQAQTFQTAGQYTVTAFSKDGNYILLDNSRALTMNRKSVTVSIADLVADKEYDGTTAAYFKPGQKPILNGVYETDTVSIKDGTLAFADAEPGTDIEVVYSGYSLTGADSKNYTLANETAADLANIDKRTLKITVSANDKIYDGTTAATGTYKILGLIGTETVSLTGGAYAFDDSSVSEKDGEVIAKTVTFSGYGFNDSTGHYRLGNTEAYGKAKILKREAKVIWSGDTGTYTYNAADQSNSITAKYFDGINREFVSLKVSYTGAGFVFKNAGDYEATAISKTASSNYSFTDNVRSLSMKQWELMVTISPENKVYDGTTDVPVSGQYYHLNTVFEADKDNVSLTGGIWAFDSPNVGKHSVTYFDYYLTGSASKNYALSNAQAIGSASITQKKLTITISVKDKVYDGTTAAETASEAVLSGVARGEERQVLLQGGTYSFDDANAGSGKTVTFSGYTITDSSGNYTWDTEVTATAAITPYKIGKGGLVWSGNKESYIYNHSDQSGSITAAFQDISGASQNAVISFTKGGVKQPFENAGDYVATASANNYVFDSDDTVRNITMAKRGGIVVAVAPPTKIEDGTTRVDNIYILDAWVGEQELDPKEIEAYGEFEDAEVGIDKNVTIYFTLSEKYAENYKTPDPVKTTGDILLQTSKSVLPLPDFEDGEPLALDFIDETASDYGEFCKYCEFDTALDLF